MIGALSIVKQIVKIIGGFSLNKRFAYSRSVYLSSSDNGVWPFSHLFAKSAFNFSGRLFAAALHNLNMAFCFNIRYNFSPVNRDYQLFCISVPSEPQSRPRISE